MYWLLTSIVFGLRSKTKEPHTKGPVARPHSQIKTATQEEEAWILCRQCRHRITRPSEGVAVNGAHQHTFANPSGFVFEIACYRNATGCQPSGMPSAEFTWFAGHTWQIMLCSRCLTHLGWFFSSPQGASFYGLIVDRIEIGSSPTD